MKWTVELSSKAVKQTNKLPARVRESLYLLARQDRGEWSSKRKLAELLKTIR